ncbi:biotin/lipoyl-containing protein [Hyphomonas johnsonii]|uniref:2-oxoglutarate dehydrogenase, E2 component, dihydrolipoamide succinyltransferase n=1 Tax=Hyphomonas johnsonii MHS-2 TaxID=1280950 RepID=A0A059FNN2_9PROT|nr:biotin/lipoyl-containing protein [Hyphomonas johnsonii]KCZ92126.1 2-oxoglutarate dehydrogenase, E2 component, dihydrolipoamide succinyltransferase [Hyphomonas johnsonii MHS-2]
MAIRVKLPDISMGVTEATIVGWLKNVGDRVEAGEPLVEVETAKSTLEVESPATGVLTHITAEVGAEIEIGAEIAVIEMERQVA